MIERYFSSRNDMLRKKCFDFSKESDIVHNRPLFRIKGTNASRQDLPAKIEKLWLSKSPEEQWQMYKMLTSQFTYKTAQSDLSHLSFVAIGKTNTQTHNTFQKCSVFPS